MMAITAQPKIAHGIARLHPHQEVSTHRYSWGPEWSLPPARMGRWVIDLIYNTAIRVEFDESVEKVARWFSALPAIDEAREALSDEDEERRRDWLEWADRREAEAFVRKWNVRKRREYGDLPTFAAGEHVRARSSGVWHIATGKVGERWDPEDQVTIVTECRAGLKLDLGADTLDTVHRTASPDAVCRRCQSRAAERRRVPNPDRSPETIVAAAERLVRAKAVLA